MSVATSASIEVDTEEHRLRLQGFGPQVKYLSDRMERVAVRLDTAGYIDEGTIGGSSFREDPPNPTLSVHVSGESENTTVVIEIMQLVVLGKDITHVCDGSTAETLRRGRMKPCC